MPAESCTGRGALAQPCPHSRVQPLLLSVTMPRKFQKPGSQRSHFRPPTPGLQEHCPVVGSQAPP